MKFIKIGVYIDDLLEQISNSKTGSEVNPYILAQSQKDYEEEQILKTVIEESKKSNDKHLENGMEILH